jgi:hypothetical protein
MKVYLVLEWSGKRAWFAGTDVRLNEFQESVQVPLFNDEAAKLVEFDFAQDARNRWREYCRKKFQSDLHISVEKYGTFIDEDRPAPSTGRDDRMPMFVFTTVGDELGYLVHPVTPPSGPCWCLKFSDHRLSSQNVFAESPEACVEKARTMGFLEIEKPQVYPLKAQRDAERKRLAEQASRNPLAPRTRPGDQRG